MNTIQAYFKTFTRSDSEMQILLMTVKKSSMHSQSYNMQTLLKMSLLDLRNRPV